MKNKVLTKSTRGAAAVEGALATLVAVIALVTLLEAVIAFAFLVSVEATTSRAAMLARKNANTSTVIQHADDVALAPNHINIQRDGCWNSLTAYGEGDPAGTCSNDDPVTRYRIKGTWKPITPVARTLLGKKVTLTTWAIASPS